MPAPDASIDLAHEQTPILDRPVRDVRAWVAADLSPETWTVPLSATALAEVGEMVASMRRHPLPMLLRSSADFAFPELAQALRAAKRNLEGGRGFAVIDGLPMDDHDVDDMVACFWVMGQLIGRPVAQKWDGTMVYDVADTGREYGYGVRGSYTNVELVFHTDNAFGLAVPDFVGLLCRHPAKQGGLSRFCSLYTVHNRMLERHPDLLPRLYRPMLYDRQAEHAPDGEKTVSAPFFAWDGRRLTARANVSLVRKGHEVAGVDLAPELADALDAIEAVSNAPELWVEAPLERGQLQYLNNREVAHYRSTFVDHDDPARRRHLYRTWHRDRGKVTYDG